MTEKKLTGREIRKLRIKQLRSERGGFNCPRPRTETNVKGAINHLHFVNKDGKFIGNFTDVWKPGTVSKGLRKKRQPVNARHNYKLTMKRHIEKKFGEKKILGGIFG